MIFTGTKKIFLTTLLVLLSVVTIGLGISLGFAVAMTKNIQKIEHLEKNELAIPSKLLDRNGNLITELIGEQKRDLIYINELPKSLVQALIVREDGVFFKHNGFNIKGFSRAMFKILTREYKSGGSTLSQQVAGHLYADRNDISVSRKIKELWWSWQLERKLSKYEILEIYLNKMYLGHSTYGVEAASQFFFKHPATENTIAENAMLVIQYANPDLYSPMYKPKRAEIIQLEILNQIVDSGYISQEEADNSFDLYRKNYDWTRDSISTAYTEREDKAPYFSEYIRGELDNMLYGKQDMLKDGYSVYTTLDLNYQRLAEKCISEGLENWNERYEKSRIGTFDHINNNVVPIIDMLSLVFDIDDIRITDSQKKKEAITYFGEEIAPSLDLFSMLFNIEDAKTLIDLSYEESIINRKATPIETALITLENETGYILAVIGGSQFEYGNQLNRAFDGYLQPGSTFKPIFYSAAISSGTYTAASKFLDAPEEFENPNGVLWTPENYRGSWSGNVLLRDALAKSLNIPSVKVLQGVGLDKAIERAADLYGITDPVKIKKTFPRLYSLALGVVSISPIQSARAYATFANQGRRVEPLAIRYVKDRNGDIFLNPEKELREYQKQNKKSNQILTPQAAYIMTNLMETSVKSGTLMWASNNAGGYNGMPMAGKTGTSQNWQDAWAAGFSPYVTTVIWAGFDKKRGESLGTNLTGATASGMVWAKYMKAIHKELPLKNFFRPKNGISEIEIDLSTGLLPVDESKPTRMEVFLTGTEPTTFASPQSIFDSEDAIFIEKWNSWIELIPIDIDIDNPYRENSIDFD